MERNPETTGPKSHDLEAAPGHCHREDTEAEDLEADLVLGPGEGVDLNRAAAEVAQGHLCTVHGDMKAEVDDDSFVVFDTIVVMAEALIEVTEAEEGIDHPQLVA